jgi:uncharacterized cupredoxin-like copper-binding protein
MRHYRTIDVERPTAGHPGFGAFAEGSLRHRRGRSQVVGYGAGMRLRLAATGLAIIGAGSITSVLSVVVGPAHAATTVAAKPDVTISISTGSLLLSTATVKNGVVSFVLNASGPDAHEVDIVRTDLAPDKLPLKPNGQFNEHNKAAVVVKEAVKVAPGRSRTFRARLTVGHYVIADNLPGHYGHHESAALTVN